MNFNKNLGVLFFLILFRWNTFLDGRRLHSRSSNIDKPSTLSVLYQYNKKASFNGRNKILVEDSYTKKRKIIQNISPLDSQTAGTVFLKHNNKTLHLNAYLFITIFISIDEKIVTLDSYSKFEDYREAMMNRGNYFTSLDALLSKYRTDLSEIISTNLFSFCSR
jgi:hypothetical protein